MVRLLPIHTNETRVTHASRGDILCSQGNSVSNNSHTSRRVFGGEVIKELTTHEFIDPYNHYMNGVNRTYQLRCYYSSCECYLKSWKVIWY